MRIIIWLFLLMMQLLLPFVRLLVLLMKNKLKTCFILHRSSVFFLYPDIIWQQQPSLKAVRFLTVFKSVRNFVAEKISSGLVADQCPIVSV
jgi:hypothetical protein